MTYSIVLNPCCDSEPPLLADGERHNLPEGLIAALRLASKFLGKAVGRRETYKRGWQTHLSFDSGSVYATNNNILVECYLGDCSLPPIVLNAKEVRLLASFGRGPTYASVSEERVLFDFGKGEVCEFPRDGMRNVFSPILSDHWMLTDNAVDLEVWERKELIRGLSIHNHAIYLVDVTSEGFESKSPYENSTIVTVEAQTGAAVPRKFSTRDLVKVLRLASRIDFSASHACFSFPGGRGLISGVTP